MTSPFDPPASGEAPASAVVEIPSEEWDLRHLAALVEHLSDPLVSTREDGRIRTWNQAAEHLYGWRAEEVRWRPLGEVLDGIAPGSVPPPAPDTDDGPVAETAAAVAVALRGETWRGELHHRRRDGAAVQVLATVAPVRDGHGRVAGAVLSLRDVSAQRRNAEALRDTERRLQRAQRLEALGRLAAGMAHDFNNTLSVVYGASQFLLQTLAEGDERRDDLRTIQEAVQSASGLTQQLLAFGRGQKLVLEPLDLDRVLLDTQRMLRRLVDADVRIETSAGAAGARVRADRGQLQQVLVNLTMNARDAMPNGGRLRIATRLERGAAEGPLPSRVVVLEVVDEGLGMDETTRARLFEPFFTTKPEGRGTGLGLAVVYGIVTQLGGAIDVQSRPGAGTRFQLRLPVLPDEGARRQPTLAPPPGPAAALRLGTLLVVEDDDRVRSSIARLLRHRGFSVVEAADAPEALSLVEADPAAFDGVLTDVVMPQMSGPALVQRLRELQPSLPVVYVTGYAADALERDRRAADPVVTKPFTVDALLDALERARAGVTPRR